MMRRWYGEPQHKPSPKYPLSSSSTLPPLPSLPTVAIKDWPDYPTRAAVLDVPLPQLIASSTLTLLSRWRITNLHLSLPLTTSHNTMLQRAHTASLIASLHVWARNSFIDIIPTLIIRDEATLHHLINGNDFDPWMLQEFANAQVSIIMGKGLHSSALQVLHWLEETLKEVSGGHLSAWAVHIWGLPQSSAQKTQSAWLSKGGKSFSICAHAASSPEEEEEEGPAQPQDPHVADVLSRAPHVTTGLETPLGPVFQLRR